jgi:hypothetical protein
MAYKKTAVKKVNGKTTPLKQMETIKKIGGKILAGGKWLAEAVEGRHGSSSYSGGAETSRQKNTPTVKRVTNAKTKQAIKKAVKYRDTSGDDSRYSDKIVKGKK